MDEIAFHSVVPQVFARVEDLGSDVWGQEISFVKGCCYLLQADSGRGKSTLCSYVSGYRHDYSGQVCFNGRDVSGYGVADWVETRRRHVSYLFQELRLFPELTAWENVAIKNALTGYKAPKTVSEWFERLGIADKKDTSVGQLSFGQQQRVAMMRALVQPFDFLLADEPISHLDDDNARQMGQLMMEEARMQGAGVIVTSIGKHMDLAYDKVVRL